MRAKPARNNKKPNKQKSNRKGQQQQMKPSGNHLKMVDVQPAEGTNQIKAFEANRAGTNMILHGCAGTGKTFQALYFGLTDVEDRDRPAQEVVIYRSAVPTRDIGFLKGDEREKTDVYKKPYTKICADLYGRDDAFSILEQKGIIRFESTSFERGTTVDDAVVIIEEFQNMSEAEVHTLLTRVGEGTRVFLCGDTDQIDDPMGRTSGVRYALEVGSLMPCFHMIEFDEEDVVRSGFLYEYLKARREIKRK